MNDIEMAAREIGSNIALRHLVQRLIEELDEIGELHRAEECLTSASSNIDTLLTGEFNDNPDFRLLLSDFMDGEETDSLSMVESGFRETASSLSQQIEKGAGR